MVGYRAGDARELASLSARIAFHAGARDLHEELGDIKQAAVHLQAGFWLYQARGRLEAAIVKCEVWKAVEEVAMGVRKAS